MHIVAVPIVENDYSGPQPRKLAQNVTGPPKYKKKNHTKKTTIKWKDIFDKEKKREKMGRMRK